MWRHPYNRKYITYRNATTGGPSYGHRDLYSKFCEGRSNSSGDMLADRQTHRQTNKLIVILSSPTGWSNKQNASEHHEVWDGIATWRSLSTHIITVGFYRTSICEGGLGSLNSVRPSVRLSVTRVHCDKTKWCTTDIFIPHERAITLLLWYQEWLVGDAPCLWNLRSKWPIPLEKRRLWPISAQNISAVKDSEKSSITTNIKSTTGFTTSHRWSAYISPKSPKGWLK